jgi:hypothetical protein
MPFSQPSVYFDLLLDPALRRFDQEPDQYDLAFAACVALDNVAELYSRQEGIGTGAARKKLVALVPDFAKVSAIANAFKHFELSSSHHGIYVGTRSEDAVIDAGAAFSDGSYYSDGTSHDDAMDVVVMNLPDGKVDVNILCNSVAAEIKNYIKVGPVAAQGG